MSRVINWFGIAAGVTTLIVVAISFFIPWWQLIIGEELIVVNASPVNTNFGVFGTQFTMPLIFALNLISILTLVASGSIMLLYSLIPAKPYSKHLLGFSYKKPLYVLLFFFFGLVAAVSFAGVFGLNIPIIGTAKFSLPTSLTMGAGISASVLASFLLPFWLSIVAVVLCVAARLFHGRVIVKKI